MDASTDALAESIRTKRVAIDNDLELLRVRLQRADPRKVDLSVVTNVMLPVVAVSAAVWIWSRPRRRVGSLQQLLMQSLADLYRAEHESMAVLDRLRARASDKELETAFAQHRLETRGHIERLERVFRLVGTEPPRQRSSPAVAAIAVDGERLLARNINRTVRDAWLIASAQRIEHLEIAGYRTARTYAETLGYAFAAQLLEQTLDEEHAAVRRLTKLGELFVNPGGSRPHRSR